MPRLRADRIVPDIAALSDVDAPVTVIVAWNRYPLLEPVTLAALITAEPAAAALPSAGVDDV